ncbi:hypothetical protein H5410_018537 [Solanum commersonii]|uniref:Uncharacterized protein n=1 Tax=Solanum commersonii TaxID=4109 RepID=A0A9J6A2E9_SOLCO|nr:hypothetical protein H5410_018537 [Solanum commersonii]
MTNDVQEPNHEEAVSCFALSKNACYVISTSGGKISLFNMMTFKQQLILPSILKITTSSLLAWMTLPSRYIMSDWMRDNYLYFSLLFLVLLYSSTSSAFVQLCVWSTVGWEMQRAKSLQLRGQSISQSDTRVQFHQDQTHFLVVHEAQISVYETAKLECFKQWVPHESDTPISHATYSCDSLLIYASFLDATVNFSITLSYFCSNSNIHPVVVAAHPEDPNQFALGMSDGGVHVFEPLESEGKWGVPPPLENGFAEGGFWKHRWVLCNLIQLKIDLWQRLIISQSNSGIWTPSSSSKFILIFTEKIVPVSANENGIKVLANNEAYSKSNICSISKQILELQIGGLFCWHQWNGLPLLAICCLSSSKTLTVGYGCEYFTFLPYLYELVASFLLFLQSHPVTKIEKRDNTKLRAKQEENSYPEWKDKHNIVGSHGSFTINLTLAVSFADK